MGSSDKPIGTANRSAPVPGQPDLCILKDLQENGWWVSSCDGRQCERLERFDTYDAAMAYAIEQRDQRADNGENVTVHHPDDCPCYRNRQASPG